MAADKETANYEAALGQQKPPPFHLPSMTATNNNNNNQKVKNQPVNDKANNSEQYQQQQPSGGHHHNVAQKGKLILPTALWILLIIAGVCFLNLLVSLNKTMNSLEELVDLEHDKVAKLEAIERSQKHQQFHQHRGLKHRGHDDERPSAGGNRHHLGNKRVDGDGDGPEMTVDLAFSDTNPIESQSSLFDFPFSLFNSITDKPQHQASKSNDKLHWLTSDLGLMPTFGRHRHQSSQQPDESISGTILVSSSLPSSSLLDDQSKRDEESGSLAKSIFKQIGPLLNGIIQQQPPEEKEAIKSNKEEEVAATQTMGPLISANIDKINVNINSQDVGEKEHPQVKKTRGNKRKPKPKHDDIAPLGSPFDSLLGKLADEPRGPSQTLTFISHDKSPSMSQLSNLLSGFPPGGPGSSMISGLPSSSFVVESLGPADHPQPPPALLSHLHNLHNNNHLHHHHHHLQGSLSGQRHRHNQQETTRPMSNLPIGHSSMVPILFALDGPADMTAPSKPADQYETAISFGGPSGELFRHGVSNTRRPSFGQSPYEFSATQLQQHDDIGQLLESLTGAKRVGDEGSTLSHSTLAPSSPSSQWNVLADDLTGAIMENLLKEPANIPQTPSAKNTDQSSSSSSSPSPISLSTSSIVIADDKPLASGDQKFSTMFPFPFMTPMEVSENNNNSNSKGSEQRIGDLFNLLFGPPPVSKLAAISPSPAPTTPAKDILSSVEIRAEPNSPADFLASQQTNTSGIPPTTTTGSPAPVEAPISSGLSTRPVADADAEETRKGLESMMNGLFTLAQSSGQSTPIRVDGEDFRGGSNEGERRPSNGDSGAGGDSSTDNTMSDLSTTTTSIISTIIPNKVDGPTPMLADFDSQLSLNHEITEPTTETITTSQPIKGEETREWSSWFSTTIGTRTTTTTTMAPAIPTTSKSPIETTQTSQAPTTTTVQPAKVVGTNSPTPSTTTGLPSTASTSPSAHQTTASSPGPTTSVHPASSTILAPPTTATATTRSAANKTSPTVRPTERPLKSFLQKADDFIERNILNLRRLF